MWMDGEGGEAGGNNQVEGWAERRQVGWAASARFCASLVEVWRGCLLAQGGHAQAQSWR